MIKILHTDTILDIIEKIENSKEANIKLSFPIWHPIIHNLISLKILKSKVQDGTLTIISHDKIAKNIGKKLDIKFLHTKQWDTKTDINLLKYNFDILSYIKFEINRYRDEFLNIFKKWKKYQVGTLKEDNPVLQVHFLFIGLLISVGIFIFLYFTTISKSYIYITPEVKAKKEALNFIFTEDGNNSILWSNKIITVEPYYKTITTTEIFWSTDTEMQDNQLSKGTVTIYNKLSTEQTLIKNTRLHTKNWLEYTIQDSVSIPAWIQDNFNTISEGKASVNVIASKKDIYWGIIWERGNIKSWESFTIPWLSRDLQESIYAVWQWDFSWWVSNFKKKVGPEDIETAKNIFTEKIKTKALNAIQQEIQEKSALNNTSLKILWWWESIQYSDLEIDINWVKEGDLVDNFSLSWSISLKVYIFNSESIIQKLKTIITEKNLSWIEKISYIDEASLRYSQLIYSHKDPFEVKLTYEIDFFTLHDFSNEESTYIKTLKSRIIWLDQNEAYKILINDTKISTVDIKVRPFFVNNISNIYNNIIIKIEEK